MNYLKQKLENMLTMFDEEEKKVLRKKAIINGSVIMAIGVAFSLFFAYSSLNDVYFSVYPENRTDMTYFGAGLMVMFTLVLLAITCFIAYGVFMATIHFAKKKKCAEINRKYREDNQR